MNEIEILKQYSYHNCPICECIYTCGDEGCCNRSDSVCPDCIPDSLGRKTLKRFHHLDNYQGHPFLACEYTLFLKRKKGRKWKPLFVEKYDKLKQIVSFLVRDTDYTNKQFKIIKFKESHRTPTLNSQHLRFV